MVKLVSHPRLGANATAPSSWRPVLSRCGAHVSQRAQPLSGVYITKSCGRHLKYTYSVPPSGKDAIPQWAEANNGQDAVLLSSNKHVYMHAKHAGSRQWENQKKSQCQKQKAQAHSIAEPTQLTRHQNSSFQKQNPASHHPAD